MFSKKIVLVTGGSSGIGEATSIAFAKEQATIVIVDKDRGKAKETATNCEKFGPKPTIITADLSNDGEVKSIAETLINLHGKLDILVNCAGILKETKFLDGDFIDKFDEVMNVNLRALAFITHIMAPYLVKSKGNIVNIASAAARSLPNAPYMAYSISKAGVVHFTKAAAKELGPFGVRVNSVSPGYVKTNIFENGGINMDYGKACNSTALGKVSESSEIADLIVFLASEKAKSVTGSNYIIDCGVTLVR